MAPSSKIRAYLSLVRVPTVFSSMSNAYAGYFIGGGRDWAAPALPLGMVASALFITAGMALNDIADRDVDALERPGRPLPSGAVHLTHAWWLSMGMLALGEALLWLANPLSALVGAALCLSIFAYNFAFKKTPLGPASMGFCRLLNLSAGITLTWTSWPEHWSAIPKPVFLALLSLWGYIALVTFLARDEVKGNTRRKIKFFLGGAAVWFVAWSAASFTWFKTEIILPVAWLALAMSLKTPFKNLASDPSAKHTGQAVGVMLRVLPLVDVLGMLVNQVPLPYALAGALWILPAYWVGKAFYST